MPRIARQKGGLGFLFAVTVLAALVWPAFSQQKGSGGNPQVQEKIAALKQSMAQSKKSLSQYTWTETTVVSLKGEPKSQKQSQCQYGPDGKVQKTPIAGEPQKEQKQPKGRVGKRVAQKVEAKKEEMTEYMQSAAALIQGYVPPDAARMQGAFQSGKASIHPAPGGVVTLVFHDYAKPGDTLSLTINGSTNTMQGVSVKSYLDEPKDAVNLNVRFDNLADGTNYVAETVLDATAKQIQVRTTNSGHHKM